jgi:choline dehydrogenase
LKRISAGANWFLFNKGICASNHFESGSFFRSAPGKQHPDIQHHFFPGAVESQKDILKVHAYQVHCGTMRPKSRGTLKLKSNNPRDKPIIQPNIYDDKEDLEDMCNAVRLTIEILQAKAFENDRHKSINFDEKMANDKNMLEQWVIQHTESAYHCSGTCAMGTVTDNQGRVNGIEGLRVCDASIMPYVPSGNTNAPTIMIAEKISDAIKNESLEPSSAKYYIPSDWMSKQR